jgi:hypothetical protein
VTDLCSENVKAVFPYGFRRPETSDLLSRLVERSDPAFVINSEDTVTHAVEYEFA